MDGQPDPARGWLYGIAWNKGSFFRYVQVVPDGIVRAELRFALGRRGQVLRSYSVIVHGNVAAVQVRGGAARPPPDHDLVRSPRASGETL